MQRDHVALAGVERAEEVGEADAVVLGLAGEDKALQLALGLGGVEDDQLVAVSIAGEVAEPRARTQVVLLAPHPLQPRREALLLRGPLDQLAPGLALDAPSAPVQLEEDVAVEIGEDIVEVDLDLTRAPEGRLGDRDVGAGGGADAVVGARRRVVGHDGLLAQLLRLGANSLDQRRACRRVDQGVHRVEPLESVLAVEDARLVDLLGLLALRIERAPAEVAVDRGSADQHREMRGRAGAAPATQIGICLEVETSSAESPIASASFSTAASMIASTGTCLPRSITV